MPPVPLRARAICVVCDSKLPPRTEAWWDEATRQATCLTCELLLRAERAEMDPLPAAAAAAAAAAAPAPPAPAPAPAPARPRPPVLDAPPPPVPTPPPAPKAVPRAAPPSSHQPPQLPRLAEVTAPTAPSAAPVASTVAKTASGVSSAAPAVAETASTTPAVELEPPLARVRGRVGGRESRPAPRPAKADLPARDIPPVPPLPPRVAGPVAAVGSRPVPPEPAAPRQPEVPAPAAARVPEPAGAPELAPVAPDPTDPEPAPGLADAPDDREAAEHQGPTASDEPPIVEQASLHHDLDPSASAHAAGAPPGGDGADLFAPAPIAVAVPNGDRPVDLMAPPRPAPGTSAHLVPAELLDRGDMGEGRVGQTLEGGRVHGLEVVHGLRIEPHLRPIDHLVVAVNGLWVVDAVDVLAGKLERRDEGDWFTADPRLHIGGADHTELVASVREKVEAVTRLLARTDFTDIPVRGVLCFGSVQPGWITEPFVLDGISITWRRKLVEPMLDPVLIDQNSRNALLNLVVSARVDPRLVAAVPVDEAREVG